MSREGVTPLVRIAYFRASAWGPLRLRGFGVHDVLLGVARRPRPDLHLRVPGRLSPPGVLTSSTFFVFGLLARSPTKPPRLEKDTELRIRARKRGSAFHGGWSFKDRRGRHHGPPPTLRVGGALPWPEPSPEQSTCHRHLAVRSRSNPRNRRCSEKPKAARARCLPNGRWGDVSARPLQRRPDASRGSEGSIATDHLPTSRNRRPLRCRTTSPTRARPQNGGSAQGAREQLQNAGQQVQQGPSRPPTGSEKVTTPPARGPSTATARPRGDRPQPGPVDS